MKFGSVQHPENIDFTLPEDHPDTAKMLGQYDSGKPKVYVGCAKWNRQELKNFYPPGTNDELTYYSSQFNAVELNATFYRYNARQIAGWYVKVPDDFRFFPKIHNWISHRNRLLNVEDLTDSFLEVLSNFMNKLGTTFLQLHDNFTPKYFDRVADFIDKWPRKVPLAIEFRHTDWYNNKVIAQDLYQLLEEKNIANIITDTAGRRDLLHMRLTKNEAFVRYVGANHPTDYSRLDDWVPRLKSWVDQGLQHIHFFVHQNDEQESPKLAAYFINQLSKELGTELKVPEIQAKMS